MNRWTARAFTLAELVMAVSITAVIGLAATGVAVSLSSLNEHSEEYYRHLQTGRVASVRLQQTLRRALLVTAGTDDSLVVWACDDNDNGQINLSELVEIHYDPVTDELFELALSLPAEMSEASRSAIDIEMSLADVIQAAANDETVLDMFAQYAARRVLARDVQAFSVRCDEPTPMTRLVSFRLSIGSGARVAQTSGAATLRAHRTAYVGWDNDTYVLSATEVGGDDANP